MVIVSQADDNFKYTNSLHWKDWYFEYNFTEIYSSGSVQQYTSIGSDNGLAQNRRQAIIWANNGLHCCSRNASLGLNELNCATCILRYYRPTMFVGFHERSEVWQPAFFLFICLFIIYLFIYFIYLLLVYSLPGIWYYVASISVALSIYSEWVSIFRTRIET